MRVLTFILDLTKPYRFYLWGMFMVVCLLSLENNIKPYLIKQLIDSDHQTLTAHVMVLAGFYILSRLFLTLTWVFSDWISVRYYSPVRAYVASFFQDRLSQYSTRFFQDHPAGSLVAKINDAFASVPMIIYIINHKFIQFILTTFITLFLLAKVHLLFSVGLIFWVMIFSFLTFHNVRKAGPLLDSYAEARSTLFGQISDYVTNMLNVRLFTTRSFEQQRFNHLAGDFIHKSRVQGRFMMVFYMKQGLTVTLYSGFLLAALLYLKFHSVITAGDFALIFMLNFQIIDRTFELSHNFQDFLTQWSSLSQALKILEPLPEIRDKPEARPLVVTRGEIIFDQVEFRYPGTEDLFANKSITLLPGQKVGLVGSSGGGKSTFVHLVLRLYEVNAGRILIDGQDIRDVSQDSLHAAIGMIPQDPSLFHRSILDNIRYGRVNASEAEVMEAARQACAHEFITQLPQGYHSLVGERGVKLSGGQRQRIAMARAYLKNAPLLILDEATSQLDSLTETDLQQSLLHFMKNKTVIVVAHRLSTLLSMDRILVLDHGKIVEDGIHQDLLDKDGVYKNLWDAQVGGFL